MMMIIIIIIMLLSTLIKYFELSTGSASYLIYPNPKIKKKQTLLLLKLS